MESKHTPGPWRASGWTIYAERGDSYRPIADTLTEYLADTLDGEHAEQNARSRVPEDEATANARLIAAAPDLLAALRDAEFLLRKAALHPGDAAAMVDSFKRSAEDARAAIDKANGGDGGPE